MARIGGARVGIRVSPYGVFNDMKPDAQMDELYTTLASELSDLGLVYIHVVDHSAMGAPAVSPAVKHAIRTHFKGAYLLSGGYDGLRAEADLAAGQGELVAYAPTIHRQPRPGAAPENRTTAGPTRPHHLLHPRRKRLHRLPPSERERGERGRVLTFDIFKTLPICRNVKTRPRPLLVMRVE